MVDNICLASLITQSIDKCEYILKNCNGDDFYLLNFYHFNYCLLDNKLYFTIPICLIILTLSFYLLSDTANKYISSSLTIISDKLGLSQNIAAMTLLSLGNGSPDIISSFVASGGDNGNVDMSIGALLGSGMVLTTLVFSLVIIFSEDGVKVNKKMYIREVFFYLFSLLVILIFAFDRRIYLWEIILYLLIYVFNLICAIYIERAMKKKRKFQAESTSMITMTIDNNFNETLASLPDIAHSDENKDAQTEEKSKEKDEKDEKDDYDDYEELSSESENDSDEGGDNKKNEKSNMNDSNSNSIENNNKNNKITFVDCIKDNEKQDKKESMSKKNEKQKENKEIKINKSFFNKVTNLNELELLVGNIVKKLKDNDIISKTDQMRNRAKAIKKLVRKPGIFFRIKRQYYNKYEEFIKLSFPKRALYILVDLPFNILRNLSIPAVEEDNYMKITFSFFPICSFIAVITILKLWLVVIKYWIIFLVIGIILLIISLLLFFIFLQKNLPQRILPFCLINFLMSIIWIYLFSNIIVDNIKFIGFLFNIPSSFLGLAFLALGNSCPDLSLDISLAKTGFGEMAIAGTSAGPLFNLIIGFGLSVFKMTVKTNHIQFNFLRWKGASNVIAFICLSLNLLANLIIALINKFQLKRVNAYISLGIFTVYLVLISLFTFVIKIE